MSLGFSKALQGQTGFLPATLLLALLLGAGLRLPHLGGPELALEEIELVRAVTGAEAEDSGNSLSTVWHFPLPRLTAKAAIWMWGQSPSGEKLRIPFAVAGVLLIPALAWLGYGIGGAPLAAVLALLAAINPFAIYASRTAQASVLVLLFLCLLGGALVRFFRLLPGTGKPRAGSPPGGGAFEREEPEDGAQLESLASEPHRKLLLLAVTSSVAAGYCSAGTWPVIALAWGSLLFLAHRQREVTPQGYLRAWQIAALSCGLLVAPLMLTGSAAWASGMSRPWQMTSWTPESPLAPAARALFVFTFGGGWRALLSLGLPLASLLLAAAGLQRRMAAWLASLGAATLFLLFLLPSLLSKATAWDNPGLALRHFTALWPILLCLCGMGILALEGWLRKRLSLSPGGRTALFVTAGCLATLALVQPLKALLQLRGNPVEYGRLAERLDGLAPKGKPVLVNGRSYVTLEMAAHRSKNSTPTYTVPDSTYEEWEGNKWRQTAVDFLTRFTDAPLVLIGERFSDAPGQGPWTFPQRHFALHEEIRNEPALLLRRLLLAPSQAFYTGRLVTQVSYNREEDLVSRAQEAGKDFLLLWGEGWGYLKTADLRDWRVLEDRADFLVDNFTSQDRSALLVLEVVASGGRKGITVGGDKILIPATSKIQLLRVRLEFPPGRSVISFEDDLWPWGKIPLWVYSARLEAEATEGSTPPSQLQPTAHKE
ncbi:MAG: hypothetical protein K0U98_23915 [Deltaproteobacteria bacterium]|nr:hypothetical protein [Deltaproteobacteria bacterium]